MFVPQVIVKSMSYFQVVELFCRLYEQTDYGNEIKKDHQQTAWRTR